MTTSNTSAVTQLYQEIQYRAPDSADLSTYVSLLNAGTLTLAEVTSDIEADPYTQNYVNPVIREYQAAFGRVPDASGVAYWVNVVANNPAALSTLSTTFANSAEFASLYGGANANTVGGTALVTALYENVLGRAPDAAGLAYWVGKDLTAAQLLQAFAQSSEFITDTASAITAYQNAEAAGDAPTSGSLFQFTTQALTAGVDNINGINTVTGDLTPFNYNGVGPTLNSTDVITNVTNLILTDGYAAGNDLIPAGAQLSNITNITLDTDGNAGTGAPFSTVGISGVESLTVNSSGSGYDYVQAAATTNISVTHNNLDGDVSVLGGDAVTVVSNGNEGVFVGDNELSPSLASYLPVGDVNVTLNSSGAWDDSGTYIAVSVEGGKAVTVDVTSQGNDGDIEIGNTHWNTGDFSGSAAVLVNPTGAVSVTDASQYGGDIGTANNAEIDIYGGSSVTVTAAGEEVVIGDPYVIAASNNTAGAISVTDTAPAIWSDVGGQEEDVYISGGSTVTVITNTGDVEVGDYDFNLNAAGTAALAGTQPTGAVSIIDTATNDGALVEVYGGTNVTINGPHTTSALDVNVGGIEDGVVLAPTGNVSIYDNASTTWAGAWNHVTHTQEGLAGIGHQIEVIGGDNINVTTNTASVFVGDTELNATDTGALAGENPAGNVTIVDTATAQTNEAGGTADGEQWKVRVDVFGGDNVDITASGARITVGADEGGVVIAPTGAIDITNTATETLAYDGALDTYNDRIDVLGGTTVTVTTNAGSVRIGEGGVDSAGSEPTGAVVVTDNSAGSVQVYGGTTVNVTSAGGSVQVGDGANALHSATSNPTGAVTVTESAVDTGWLFDSSVKVEGGTSVTVNTTGGDVYVGDNFSGDGATPVTGAVIIDDTFGGITKDDIAVMGGTSVTITESASRDNYIDVGASGADILNAAGTALSTTGDYVVGDDPTGPVVITDETVNGSVITYGREAFNVWTNGSTSVSITGGSGHDNWIGDLQSTILTGAGEVAAGVSKLSTISLTGVNGITNIQTDALSNLTVANSEWFLAKIYDNTINSAISVTAYNDANLHIEDAGGSGVYTGVAYIGSLTINTTGTEASVVSIDAAGVTSLTINDGAGFILSDSWPGTDLGGLTSVTVTGAGATFLGDLSDATDLATINASAATGGVFVEFDPSNLTDFTGGAGNDVVVLNGQLTAANLTAGETITGGGGTNILYVDAADSAFPLGNDAIISGFQELGVVGAANGTYNAEGFRALLVGMDTAYTGDWGVTGGNTLTFTNVEFGAALDLIAPGDVTNIYYELSSPGYGALTPPGGPATIDIGQDANGALLATEGVGSGLTVHLRGFENDITTLDVVSAGAAGYANTLNVNDSTLTTLVVSGDAGIEINIGASDTLLTSVNASAATGPVVLNGIEANESSAGVTITGGAGGIFAEGYDNTTGKNVGPVDVYNVGSGGGVIIAGDGGAGYQDTGKATTTDISGSETINLTAGAKVGTVVVADPTVWNPASMAYGKDGANVLVNNWTIATVASGGATTDALALTAGEEVIANAANVAGQTGAVYNISDGVISLANGSPTVSGTQELSDAIAIVDAAAPKNSTGLLAMVTVPVVSGSGTAEATFIIEEGKGGGKADTIVELAGGVTATGFGGIADAANPADPANISGGASIALAGVTNYTALFANVSGVGASKETGLAGLASYTANDTGLSLDTLDVLNSTSGVLTDTYSNLANFGVIEGEGTASDVNVTVTQVGIDPILTLTALGTLDINVLTYGNSAVAHDDPTLLVYSEAGTITINSVVDASNTGTDLLIAGANSVTIDGVTDTALKLVNAGELEASLTLTANQNGLTVVGSGFGDTITANGKADIIQITSGDYDVAVTAGGAGDTVTLKGGYGALALSGAGDTVNVSHTDSTVYVTGNGDNFSSGTAASQLAAGDTINATDATVHTWLGANSTVNLADGATADVHVLGDTAGASLTNLTTITGVGVDGDSLRLHLNDYLPGNSASGITEAWAGGHAWTSQVNVASATSLAAALNIAASQALVYNVNLDGSADAAVAGQNSAAAAYELNGHTGLVDWFQYGGNTYIVEAVNSTASAATHNGLASGDIVVKLTGLVDVSHSVDVHFA